MFLISSLFNFVSFFIYIFTFFKIGRRRYVSIDIKRGLICYQCKEEIESMDDYIRNVWASGSIKPEYNRRLCLSCKRNKQLGDIITNNKHLKIDKKYYLKIQMISVFISIILNIISIFYKNNIYGTIASTFALVGAIFFHLDAMYSTKVDNTKVGLWKSIKLLIKK